MSKLLEQFAHPGSLYRGKPFWAWNGKLEAAEAVRQIQVMKRMGLGGFFMHSRVGLATPFLSEEWFSVVSACVEAARQLGMEAWLYDEDRWPSGAAGGLVTRDKRWRARRLEMRLLRPAEFHPQGDELAVFWGRLRPNYALADVHRYEAGPLPEGDDVRVLAFRVVLPPESPWYNGATYLDTLSPAAVDKFIEVAYEPYLRRFGRDFGSVVPGVFTDEPNHSGYDMHTDGGRKTVFQVPWTDRLPEEFAARYGYSVLDHLPEIFFDREGEPVSSVRHDFHDCTTHLFVTSFSRQIGRWCGNHGLMFTGHALCEWPPSSQTVVGGSTLRFYEHMQAPGIDILTEIRPEYMTAKQCASVLHQMGRRWMLSELYGCTGWDFPFEGHKAIGDWQTALGVNIRCHHLCWYTMLGQAKRDYPASIFFQSPWWRDYPLVEDYFSRLHVLLSEGEPVRDVLVIHNNESSWLRCRLGAHEDGTAREPDGWLEEVERALLESHLDFDYADEEMLPRLGKVVGEGEAARLQVGQAVYQAVVVPRALSWRSSTLELLEAFAAAGGTVVCVEPPAACVDCRPSDRVTRLADRVARVASPPAQLADRLLLRLPRRVSIQGPDGLEIASTLYMLRRHADRHYLFVCNTDRSRGYEDVRVVVEADGQAQEWDPTDGAIYRAHATRSGSRVTLGTSLAPSGSRLFVLDAGCPPEASPRRRRPIWRELRRQVLGGRSWTIQRDEPNAIVLDRPEFRLRPGRWKGPEEVLRIDRLVRETAGLPRRGGAMAQPWTRADQPSRDLGLTVDLRFRFEVRTIPSGPLHLVVERPDRYAIQLNGHGLVADQDEGWWIDPALVRLRVLPSMLVVGPNVLQMSIRYRDDDPGLEAVYLTGEFGVRLRERTAQVRALPTSLALGDWGPQGFPFYSGTITYARQVQVRRRPGESVFLVLEEPKATLLRVRVNGRPVGSLGWPPYEIDLTDHVEDGPCRLEIDVVSSRRNLLGPLHLWRPGKGWVGPGEYEPPPEHWTDDYVLVPYGLMKAPILSYRKKR